VQIQCGRQIPGNRSFRWKN